MNLIKNKLKKNWFQAITFKLIPNVSKNYIPNVTSCMQSKILWAKSIKYGFTKFKVTNQEGVVAKKSIKFVKLLTRT
jgi:hypothetical protein